MKKNNKKGFFLSETMVVIAIVAVVLLGVFKLFNSVYFSFIEGENYNTVNAINALSNIQKYYESKGNIDTSLITEEDSYVNLTNLESYDSEYYDRLKQEFNVGGIYLVDLNKLYSSNDINDFYLSFRKYLNTLKNIQGVVLVIELNSNEYAYTQIENYQPVTLIGNEDDEFVVYVPTGEIFVDPGYKNWEGTEPTITWDNDTVVDTSKPGTYYKYYDFNGYLLRRKIKVGPVALSKYVDNLEILEESLEEFYNNGLYNPIVEYEGNEYDTGIRYNGTNPNNYVYYNCDDTDTKGVSYGSENYDYESSCEVWRIIGVFDVSNGTTTEKRIKLINTTSTFKASWDSSSSDLNYGNGINQWGESIYINGTEYKGSDLMQLLNGYYISKKNAVCIYCNTPSQETCSQTCTADSLKEANMKVLTSTAKGMIEDAVWDTYAVKVGSNGVLDISFANATYLEEKGISAQYVGNTFCVEKGGSWCNDSVNRTTSWIGSVGLMSTSDILYANGWLFGSGHWAINPTADTGANSNVKSAYAVWSGADSFIGAFVAYQTFYVYPTVYLKSNVRIIKGNGQSKPYILK